MPKIKDVDFYNQASSAKLGWLPSWFGCQEFDEALSKAIKKFQKEHALTVDGLCGPQTFRRIYTEHQAKIELAKYKISQISSPPAEPKPQKFVYCGTDKVPIQWDKFVQLDDPGNLALPAQTYRLRYGKKPKLFVVHWDACLSSRSCFDVLKRRGLSVNFSIDNCGKIFQMVDCQYSAQHAGSVNSFSIGVEISNAVNLKYQQHYINSGFGPRPIVKDAWCHGRNFGPILGFYPIQIEALKVLLKTVCEHYQIPLETPTDGLVNLYKPALEGKFQGVVQHYHIDKGKQDCAGLNLQQLLEEIKSK